MKKETLGIYQHFKGNLYEVIGFARHRENPNDELVVYKALYNHPEFGENSLWVRQKSMFFENVTREGNTFPRFKFIKA